MSTAHADMGCKLDPEYLPYKRFLLTTMRHDSVSSQAALPEVTASDSQVGFRCSIACHVASQHAAACCGCGVMRLLLSSCCQSTAHKHDYHHLSFPYTCRHCTGVASAARCSQHRQTCWMRGRRPATRQPTTARAAAPMAAPAALAADPRAPAQQVGALHTAYHIYARDGRLLRSTANTSLQLQLDHHQRTSAAAASPPNP
jgi:hypothetical protein